MAKKFQITTEFNGYRAKTDDTKLAPGFLVSGSQNVIITDGDRVAARKGYTIDGAAASGSNPIKSSYDWKTNTGTEVNIRSFDTGTFQFRLVDGTSVTWTAVKVVGGAAFANSANVDFEFAEYWDTNENRDILLFVNGSTNVYAWTGAHAKVDITNSTSNTLKLQDTTTTWTDERFVTNGSDYSKKITIGGTEYTYTGGEGTDTLTGVTGDPTAGGHSDGDYAIQAITAVANTPSSAFNANLIGVRNNQVFYGNTTNRQVFVSKVNDFDDVTFSSPRTPGEGALLTFDGATKGFVVQEENMYVTSGDDWWYRINFTLSDDLTKETLTIKPLKTAPRQAAKTADVIAKIKNNVVYISEEPTFDSLGRLENLDTPQSKPISDPIKSDFDGYNFANAHIKYWRNNIYIALPSESLVLIFNIEKGYWEAPQTLPARRLAIIGGNLYIHSSLVDETYKMFDGRNDNTQPIKAVARFSYLNFGDRAWQKNFDEWFSEGYIETNTELTLALRYEYQGGDQIQEYTIEGDDTDILFGSTEDASLGKQSLGKHPLGGTQLTVADDDLPSKFRIKHTMVRRDFYEIQAEYSSDQEDANWELLAMGPNAILSRNEDASIKI